MNELVDALKEVTENMSEALKILQQQKDERMKKIVKKDANMQWTLGRMEGYGSALGMVKKILDVYDEGDGDEPKADPNGSPPDMTPQDIPDPAPEPMAN